MESNETRNVNFQQKPNTIKANDDYNTQRKQQMKRDSKFRNKRWKWKDDRKNLSSGVVLYFMGILSFIALFVSLLFDSLTFSSGFETGIDLPFHLKLHRTYDK